MSRQNLLELDEITGIHKSQVQFTTGRTSIY